MSVGDVIVEVNKHLATNFTTTPIAYENVAFNNAGVKEYVAVFVEPSLVDNITIGNVNDTYRDIGRVRFVVYGELEKGAKRVADIQKELLSLFLSNNLNGVTFRNSAVSPSGAVDGYFMGSIALSYYYDAPY